MKISAIQKTAALTAVAALMAACGGSDDPAASAAAPAPAPAPASGVVLEGVAATGLALANAPVTVKCAGGNGTATTNASGAFSVTVSGAALPCLVQVTGTVNGNTVTLHSVSEAGTSTGSSTTARANVTPLTELIVARLLGQLPATAFESFSGANAITPQQVTAATTAIVQAVKDATGVDLGTIDPFKATLVAATTASPTAGNDYDRLLDALGDKLDVQSLPLVAAQVAGGSSGSALAQSLSTAPNCPSAVSGRYRTVDLLGEVVPATFDFKAMTVRFDGHTDSAPVAQNPAQPCDFSLGSAQFAEDADWRFAIGPQGAGAFRGTSPSLSTSATTDVITGYIFPIQPATTLAAAAGDWTFAQSGVDTSEPANSPKRVNWLSRLTVGTDGALTGCDYAESANWTGACTTDATDGESVTLVAGTDGGYDLRATAGTTTVTAGRVWFFRAPDGSLTGYGTSTVLANTPQRTSIIGTKLRALPLPTAGTVNRSLSFITNATSGETGLLAGPPARAAVTVQTVNATAGTFTRLTDASGAQPETLGNNAPQNGLRVFTARPTRVQLPLPAGLTVTLDRPALTAFRHSISVALPR